MKPMNVETAKWRRDAIENVPVDMAEHDARSRRRRTIIIAAIVLIVAVVGAIFLFGGRGEQAEKAPAGAAAPGAQKGGGALESAGKQIGVRALPEGTSELATEVRPRQ